MFSKHKTIKAEVCTAPAFVIAVILICLFIFVNGVPAIFEIGPGEFLGGIKWKPLQGLFGILPMIVGSIYVTAGCVIFGVPVGILCAIFMARFCHRKLYKVIKPAIELLAGFPSFVFDYVARLPTQSQRRVVF